MFDVSFYMKSHDLQKQINVGQRLSRQDIMEHLESFRDSKPFVYNIETTNACNMKCAMCPRTTMMTRSIETIDDDVFSRVVDQISPFSVDQWNEWKNFVLKEYGVAENAMSENHFFLYVIPRIVQLHGYGDPLLDKNLPKYIGMLKQRKLQSYFSCNPANINIKKMLQMFENGLDYVKFSIESVDDASHKVIRGEASNFTKSYRKILRLLETKSKEGFPTTIVITMLDLSRKGQVDEFEKLRQAFRGLDVYIYLKSEDTQWYRKVFHETRSIHWSEFCKHPWMSMTIKSNGEAAMCMEDFNNEIVLGDVRKKSLSDIWNNEEYKDFRLDHINLTKDMRCTVRCDMNLIGEYIE